MKILVDQNYHSEENARAIWELEVKDNEITNIGAVGFCPEGTFCMHGCCSKFDKPFEIQDDCERKDYAKQLLKKMEENPEITGCILQQDNFEFTEIVEINDLKDLFSLEKSCWIKLSPENTNNLIIEKSRKQYTK